MKIKMNKAISIMLTLVLLVLPLSVNAMGNENASGSEDVVINPYITKDKSLVSAHRSGGGIAPENTLMAFKNCIDNKDFDTDIFEFDLHITSDGVLVLLHDPELDRTSNSSEHFNEKKVKASDKTYEELRALNMGEFFETDDEKTPYKGLRGDDITDDLKITRLEDVLDFLGKQEKKYSYIIEIKNKKELGYKAADELYKILEERALLDFTIVGTFNGEVTQYLDEKYSDLKRSAGIMEVIKFYFANKFNVTIKAENIQYEALQVPNKMLFLNLSTQKFIDRAHGYNVAVQYWTINEEADMRLLNERGADAIITDYPDIASRVVNE